MSVHSKNLVLVASCPDKVGINRDVSQFLYDIGASITQTDQFSERETARFFMRYAFTQLGEEALTAAEVRDKFQPVGDTLQMNWQIHDTARKTRTLIAVSKIGHCLNDLLYRWRNGDLETDIVGVVSNHEDMRSVVEWHGLPYHYLPVDNNNRSEQEQAVATLIDAQRVDLLVLARYMQILSPTLCEKLPQRAINIHHSFLPSFKGARPYHQAHSRGVKQIGATAHYVTTDLDEGPIIEQDVQRIGHGQSSRELIRIGSEIEARVLTRSVRWHCEHRILLSDHRTIVFD